MLLVVLGFSSARTELEPGAGGAPFDTAGSESPENEILRVMAEPSPGSTVFLPLDDPLFVDRQAAYNSEDVIYVSALRDQYDACPTRTRPSNAHRLKARRRPH